MTETIYEDPDEGVVVTLYTGPDDETRGYLDRRRVEISTSYTWTPASGRVLAPRSVNMSARAWRRMIDAARP